MIDSIHNYSILIFGLGREGLSTYKFLRADLPDQEITLVDEKPLEDLNEAWGEILRQDGKATLQTLPTLAKRGNPSQEGSFTVVFRSAGIPRSKVEQLFPSAEISSNTQLFFETVQKLKTNNSKVVTIGITGTKGKSTTSSAIHHVLKESGFNSFLGGNIGKPPLEVLREFLESKKSMKQKAEPAKLAESVFLVLELSSHQLSDLRYSPNIAVILDVVPEHLDYYANFEEYWEAKSQIARYQVETDLILYNEESVSAVKIAELSSGRKIGFGRKGSESQRLKEVVALEDLKVVGSHNYLNLLPSVLIGQYVGLPNDQIATALKSFSPLPHRLEKVAEINGVTFINDSLATTPQATMAALKAFEGSEAQRHKGTKNLLLIAGGYDRGLDYSELGPAIVNGNVKALILFRPTGEKIFKSLETEAQRNKGAKVEIIFITTMEEAVEQAWKLAEPGDVVLMSPASASFGMFKDYADRGVQFAEAVSRLT